MATPEERRHASEVTGATQSGALGEKEEGGASGLEPSATAPGRSLRYWPRPWRMASSSQAWPLAAGLLPSLAPFSGWAPAAALAS